MGRRLSFRSAWSCSERSRLGAHRNDVDASLRELVEAPVELSQLGPANGTVHCTEEHDDR